MMAQAPVDHDDIISEEEEEEMGKGKIREVQDHVGLQGKDEYREVKGREERRVRAGKGRGWRVWQYV